MKSISDNLVVCIRSVSEREWEAFFAEIRDAELALMETSPKECLTDIQAGCKMITKIRSAVLSIRNQQPNQKQS